MSIREIITMLQEKLVRFKYYGDQWLDKEAFEQLIKDLSEIETHMYDDHNLALERELGFIEAKRLVLQDVLENEELKTRGEMIEAVNKLELIP